MADDFTIRLDPDAVNNLVNSSEVGAHLLQVGLQVETAAKRLAPVDTGRLRSSITTNMHVDSEGPVVVIGTDVDYAVYQEFGTSRQAGTPFLRPALEQVLGGSS